MKNHHSIIGAVAITILGMESGIAFDSGSDGSFGPLDVGSGSRTIQLPPDGVLNCTTINIAANADLRFTRNATNTPIYLLSTGDITISGRIWITGSSPTGKRGGASGPGGFDGGQGGANPSDGFGPGAGKAGWVTSGPPNGEEIRGGGGFGTSGTPATTGGSTYGNSLLIPLVGGSGGGGGNHGDVSSQFGGGGGGGAILIASNTSISISQNSSNGIYAYGGSPNTSNGGGSGGAVRLVAPVVSGSANVQIWSDWGGGHGRIRVDALSNSITFFDSVRGTSQNHVTSGANMVVFPPNMPEVRITQAAGTSIAVSQTDPVFVLLPPGSPASQQVHVQVKDFHGVVPLVAVVTPEAGGRTSYNLDVDNSSGGTSTGSVVVQIPAGVSTRVDVWTR